MVIVNTNVLINNKSGYCMLSFVYAVLKAYYMLSQKIQKHMGLLLTSLGKIKAYKNCGLQCKIGEERGGRKRKKGEGENRERKEGEERERERERERETERVRRGREKRKGEERGTRKRESKKREGEEIGSRKT